MFANFEVGVCKGEDKRNRQFTNFLYVTEAVHLPTLRVYVSEEASITVPFKRSELDDGCVGATYIKDHSTTTWKML